MKVLIWICVFFLGGIVNLFFQGINGITERAVLAMGLFLLEFYTAKMLCKKWDEHKSNKEKAEDAVLESASDKVQNTAFSSKNILEPHKEEVETENLFPPDVPDDLEKDSEMKGEEQANDIAVSPEVKKLENESCLENDTVDTRVLKTQKKQRGIVVSLAIITVFLVGLNVFQYVSNRDNAKEISTLKDELNEQTVFASSLSARLDLYADKANDYNEIISALKAGYLGYASDNFNASESVILVGKNERNRKFTLTAYWPRGGNVTTQYSLTGGGTSATVSFDNNEWNTTTRMTVNPQSVGVTKVKFSNDVDGEFFYVVIIVTE